MLNDKFSPEIIQKTGKFPVIIRMHIKYNN